MHKTTQMYLWMDGTKVWWEADIPPSVGRVMGGSIVWHKIIKIAVDDELQLNQKKKRLIHKTRQDKTIRHGKQCEMC